MHKVIPIALASIALTGCGLGEKEPTPFSTAEYQTCVDQTQEAIDLAKQAVAQAERWKTRYERIKAKYAP